MYVKWQQWLTEQGANWQQGKVHCFADLKQELSWSMQHHSICDLSHFGTIAVTGEDAAKFLQGQLSCNIEDLTTENSCLGVHCNAKGRVLFLFRIFKNNQTFYLSLPKTVVNLAIQHLKKYAIFSKINIDDISDNWLHIGIISPSADALLTEYFAKIPITANHLCTTNQVFIIKIAAPIPRWEIIGNAQEIIKIWENYANICKKVSTAAWDLLNINAGLTWIYPETTAIFTPHNLNLQELGAISFTKGCYTGQEIIARMHYRGTIKQQLYSAHLATNNLPTPGQKLYTAADPNNPIGYIVDSCQDVNDEFKLLLSIKNQAATANNVYYPDTKNQQLQVTAVAYP